MNFHLDKIDIAVALRCSRVYTTVCVCRCNIICARPSPLATSCDEEMQFLHRQTTTTRSILNFTFVLSIQEQFCEKWKKKFLKVNTNLEHDSVSSEASNQAEWSAPRQRRTFDDGGSERPTRESETRTKKKWSPINKGRLGGART